ncbi:MAG: type II secretion system F family protein [Chlamydiae bacterium]|nr:type II secretion system F family protein [Chlamydiota bacterium]
MPLFQYKSLTYNGKESKGIIDADSLLLAKERLRKQQILITEILPLRRKASDLRLPPLELIAFTRELSQLLRAGLPLHDSLQTIEEKQRGSKYHTLFADLCDQLSSGHSLSKALRRYPKTFSEVYLSLVHASEQTGSLASAFQQLYLLLSKQQKWKKQLVSTLTYPALLGVFCLLVTSCLFFFVVPSMEELFVGRELHPLTELVLCTSRFLNTHILALAITFVSLLLGACLLGQHKAFRAGLGKKLLQTPLIKDLLLASSLTRFFRTMHMLVQGGVPFVEALGFAKYMVHNPALRELFIQAEQELVEGKKIASVFAASSLLPPLVIRMFHIGEESGSMNSLLQNLADIYEEDLEQDLSKLTTYLQPALLLFIGLVVGLVVLSILLPLTDVSSFTT